MGFTETTAQRIREALLLKNVFFTEKQMFGGVCFMVDEKMLCCTRFDNKTSQDLLLCRVGDMMYENVLQKNDCIPMDFSGKAMKGYVYVTENSFRNNTDLNN